MIDCREAVTRMWAYLSEGLEAHDAKALEDHLGVCQRCCGELEFSRQLQERVAEAGFRPIPPALRGRIEDLMADPDATAADPS
jgi:hypothetical protein